MYLCVAQSVFAHYSTSYISDTCYFVYTLCILILLIEFAFIDSKRNVTLRGISMLSFPQ